MPINKLERLPACVSGFGIIKISSELTTSYYVNYICNLGSEINVKSIGSTISKDT